VKIGKSFASCTLIIVLCAALVSITQQNAVAKTKNDVEAINEKDKDDCSEDAFVKTRGVVLIVKDMDTLKDWPEKAKKAGLTTIATHPSPKLVAEFFSSEAGQEFFQKCIALGLHVEHELHAMHDLLPRHYFDTNPEFFPMNEKGQRVRDYNCCVSSKQAVEIICENAVKYAKILKPTTGRYFYWFDDVKPMCKCPKCRIYSDSDQALILENKILESLKKIDSRAQLAHLAYKTTLKAPTQIKPSPGIFLEFAPIDRRLDMPISDRDARRRCDAKIDRITHGEYLDLLDENLKVFDSNTAQILEYWLDVSLFSKWKYPAIKLPWNRAVFLDDLKTYTSRGIRHITSFGAYIDGDYVKNFGWPPINEYGAELCKVKPY